MVDSVLTFWYYTKVSKLPKEPQDRHVKHEVRDQCQNECLLNE